jgi:hypothetical protein
MRVADAQQYDGQNLFSSKNVVLYYEPSFGVGVDSYGATKAARGGGQLARRAPFASAAYATACAHVSGAGAS